MTTLTAFSLPPDTLLQRKATAKALAAVGYPVTAATLTTYASRGNGPPYAVFGRHALYRWGEVIDWAEGRMIRRGE